MESMVRLIAFVVVTLALSRPAHAYLDPVTGSLIVQGLIALVAGVLAGVKTIRVRFLAALSALLGRKHQ